MSKVGLVLEGGAFRGIFTAGVLDCLIDERIEFPYLIGASAGACNAVNYIAGQRGRTKKVITHEHADPYFGLGQFAKSRKILDLDKMLYEYAYDQIPMDFDAFFQSSAEAEFVVMNCESGEADYLTAGGSEERLLEICKATCSVPFVCSPVELDGAHYMDGSVADSVPFARAFARGCDRVVVVLTRKEGELPTNYAKMRLLVDVCYRKKYPHFYDALMARAERYEKSMCELLSCEREGKALVIRPSIGSIGHFENDSGRINSFYQHGYSTMTRMLPALRQFLGKDAAGPS